MKTYKYVFLFLYLSFVAGYGNTYTLSGTTRDLMTNEPLSFASIYVEGINRVVVSDNQGRFFIDLLSGNYILQFSYIGYMTEKLPVVIERDLQLTVEMKPLDMILQDVSVRANRSEIKTGLAKVSTVTIESGKIEETSSLSPDVLRTSQMLPGVSANNEFSAKFNVRGGTSDENLIIIDGTEMYEPYHLREAGNVSIGIFNNDFVKKMDLITGGYSACYGDKMSSVTNIEYREGNAENYRGKISLSIADLNLLAEGPVGSFGSFIIGLRQSYMQQILKMLNHSGVYPSFYDLQGLLTLSLSHNNKLSLRVIHSNDKFNQEPEKISSESLISPRTLSGFQNSAVRENNYYANSLAYYYSNIYALQSTNILSNNTLFKASISYYNQFESYRFWDYDQTKNFISTEYSSTFSDNIIQYTNINEQKMKILQVNSSLDFQSDSFYGFKLGADYKRYYFNHKKDEELISTEFTNNIEYPDTVYTYEGAKNFNPFLDSVRIQTFKLSGYLENIFLITDKFAMNIGARVDYFGINKNLTWSPRVNFSYRVLPWFKLAGAWGYFYQSPMFQQLATYTSSDTNTHSQKAEHYILSMEFDLLSDISREKFMKFRIEGYYKKYYDLISSILLSNGVINYSRKNDSIGKSRGLDFYFEYSLPSFSGWISYSFLKAEQKLINSPFFYLRDSDQRHTLSAVSNLDFGKGWKISSRVVYGSGFAYTPSVAVYNSSNNGFEWQLAEPNSEHLPAYKRVDLHISKEFELFDFTSSLYLDINNVFNFKNIFAYVFSRDSEGNLIKSEVKLWPLLPSLGLTIKF